MAKKSFFLLLGAVISVDTGKCIDYKVCPVHMIAEPKGHRCIQEVCKYNQRLVVVLDLIMMAQLVRLRPKVLWNALVPPLKNTTYVTLGDNERVYLHQNTVY